MEQTEEDKQNEIIETWIVKFKEAQHYRNGEQINFNGLIYRDCCATCTYVSAKFSLCLFAKYIHFTCCLRSVCDKFWRE